MSTMKLIVLCSLMLVFAAPAVAKPPNCYGQRVLKDTSGIDPEESTPAGGCSAGPAPPSSMSSWLMLMLLALLVLRRSPQAGTATTRTFPSGSAK